MSKLYVCMVGLPARGKSRLAKRIAHDLNGLGVHTAIFNNGDMRRERFGCSSAEPYFFSKNNVEAMQARKSIARENMLRAQEWLATKGDVAILDATNGTRAQRNALMGALRDHPMLFIECVNEDPVLLEASILRKTRLPEFSHLTEKEALESFYERIDYYAEGYEPLVSAPCWIRVDPVNCEILAEAPSSSIPYYAAIRNIVSLRWVNNLYLVRHGETVYNQEGRLGGNANLTEKGKQQAQDLAKYFSGIHLPFLFTSTKARTAQMAEPLLSTRQSTTVTAMAEFDEINAGICEEMTYAAVKEQMPEEYKKRSADKYTYVYPQGESYEMLKKRVERGLRRAMYMAGDNPLMIVGHQAINRIILSLFLFHREEDVPYMFIPQNQFFHITVTQKERLFKMVSFA